MAFNDLPPQPPVYPPEAEDYARKALALSLAVAQTTRCTLDIPYGTDYWQKVDVYVPDDAPADLPVLVFAHGGAWTHGYKEWMGLMAPPILAAPAILVSVSYRLAPASRFPVPLEDCLAALQWVHGNIARFGGDPNAIYVGGHSAGGHLYALLALSPERIQHAGLPADVIKGCFPVSSQLNLVFSNPPPGSGEARIYEMFLADAKDAEAASPLHQVKGNGVPFFVSYGGNDFPRIIASNLLFIDALRQQPAPLRTAVYADHTHFDTALAMADAEHPWVRTVVQWMQTGHAPKGD